MDVISIEARDIYIRLGFSVKDITRILEYLNHCTMEFDSVKEPEMVQAKEYVENKFFRQLDQITEDIENGTGPDGQRI